MIKQLLYTAIMSFAISSCAESENSQEKNIWSDHASINISGRHLRTHEREVVLSYPGATISIETDAEYIIAELSESALLSDSGLPQNNTIAVIIDGVYIRKILLQEGLRSYDIAQGLTRKMRRIQLVKLTEGLVGQISFHRFVIPVDAQVSTTRQARRTIEFIGNSITCGYGIESAGPDEHFSHLTENAYKAYAMQASRMLDADAYLVSYSGKGIYRNWADTIPYRETMLELYQRTMPLDTHHLWDFAQIQPDAVVVSLGSNDFSPPLGADSTLFIPRYTELLRTVRQNYGSDVAIICINSPLLTSKQRIKLASWIGRCMHNMHDANIHYFEPSVCSTTDGWGADGHPSQQCADRNALELSAFIRNVLNW